MLAAAAFTLLLVTIAMHYSKGIKVWKSETRHLITNLQEKLMQDNYDYMSQETEEPLTVRPSDNIKTRNSTNPDIMPHNMHQQTSLDSVQYRSHTNYYVSDLKAQKKPKIQSEEKEQKTINVANKDLLFYVDEKKLSGSPNTRVTQMGGRSVTYKFLKSKKKYRRNMDTRFIQEEGEDGVVLLRLGEGPFPVLQLPPSRRQYMHNHDDIVSEEEELPPPPISSSSRSSRRSKLPPV